MKARWQIPWTRLLTTDQAAEHANVSRPTIIRWYDTGKIDGHLYRKTLLIDRVSLDRYLDSQPKHAKTRGTS